MLCRFIRWLALVMRTRHGGTKILVRKFWHVQRLTERRPKLDSSTRSNCQQLILS